MIAKQTFEQAIFNAIAKGSTTIAPDVCAAFEKAIDLLGGVEVELTEEEANYT